MSKPKPTPKMSDQEYAFATAIAQLADDVAQLAAFLTRHPNSTLAARERKLLEDIFQRWHSRSSL